MNSTLIRGRALIALLGTLALASASQAQSPNGDDIQQTVVRVAYFSGEVSYSRGDNPDDWQPASLNFPMTLGDRLYTARGSRLELQTEGGAIYLAPETDLAALNLTYEVKQFSLGMGSASFRIRQIDSGESFEVDTPNAAVTFDRAGEYRIDVDRDGNTRVIVKRGHAYVAAAGGEVPLEAGRVMAIDGIDSPVYDITSLPRPDSWDQWVATRSRPSLATGSRRYVSADISGVDDLDQYGRWSEIPEYGTVWSPANVSADWQPYRAGRWAWQDPWGWSWVSNESWGWAPYHYGRWVTLRSRWYWVPVGPEVRTVRYAPALVAFVGGPGSSLSVSVGGGGNVGWFPLAPRDPFVPWWGSRARERNPTNVTNVTYVNRTYVTVVNQNTFLSGAPVARNMIRDAGVVREISAAPVVRGPLQVVPVASSIRVSTERPGSAPRPPAAALTRPVVTRLAPAPAPALFHEKANLIRENHGAPVDPAQAARLSPVSRAIQPIRPVVVEPGRVTLTPKKPQGSGSPAPVPVTREVPPGQARREAPPAGARELPPGQAKGPPALQQQQLDTRKAQETENARKVQEAEGARKAQQQQLDTRKAQETENARKVQEAEGARKAQQQQLDTRKAQETENARKVQGSRRRSQGPAAATRHPQSTGNRKRPQGAAEGARARPAAAARRPQSTGNRKHPQGAEAKATRRASNSSETPQGARGRSRSREAAAGARYRKGAEATAGGRSRSREAAAGARRAQDTRNRERPQGPAGAARHPQSTGSREHPQGSAAAARHPQGARGRKAQGQGT